MEFAQTWIRAFAAIALLAMAAPFGPVSADRGSSATECHIGHHTDKAVPVGQDASDEFDLADHYIPICPAGCSHSAGLGCCGSVVLATPSVIVVAISASGHLPDEVERSLSGVEPAAPQKPPQHSA
jgi:hypothetical protein